MAYRAYARRRPLQRARRGFLAALAALMFLVAATPGLSANETDTTAVDGSDDQYLLETALPAESSSPEGLNAPPSAPDVEQSERPEMDERPAPPVQEALAAPPALGETIVGIAMSYLGYPYAAAGNSPAGFDCSGFTQFVVGAATGIWIPHAVEAQPYSAGYWVDWGAWQPGDLIFFQNTYRAGISHAAIYIGDGMIVHAENYGSGVTTDSIYSDYYGPRYWGAIRIG